MEALKAEGVWRTYGAQHVLKGVDLTLESGAFEVLMGPSGCGKSTFLHLAAGLLAPNRGSVVVGGTDLSRLSDAELSRFRRRHVGVVFQSFNLLHERTVEENILMPLRLESVRAARTAAQSPRFAELVERLELGALLKKRPEQLSGGECQRVAVARALLPEPAVVLADEPTGNLDAPSADCLCVLLADLKRTEKSAILLVTHDPRVAACADRVNFLKDGRIVAAHPTQHDAAHVSQLYLETYA